MSFLMFCEKSSKSDVLTELFENKKDDIFWDTVYKYVIK